MLGVPSAAMHPMLIDPVATNHPDILRFIVPMQVPSSVLVASGVTLKLDGLVRIPNKRRAREARRLRMAMGIWPWGKR